MGPFQLYTDERGKYLISNVIVTINKMGAGARIEKAVLDISGSKVTAVIRDKIDRGVKMTKKKARAVSDKTKDQAQVLMYKARMVLYNSVATVLTFMLIVALSFFFYGTFYYAYMPLQVHEHPINLQFQPCADNPGVCSYPNASMQLNKKIRLMTGQPYSISLKLDVPDSTVNQNVGMFMSCMKIHMQDSKSVDSCQSAILEFRSQFLIYLETLVFSPFLVSGTSSQKQWLTVDYFNKYFDDPHNPASRADITIQSRFLQVYAATVLIHAEFSGLRHIIYHHPWISTAVGVCGNFILLSTIILISWTRFFTTDDEPSREEMLRSGLIGDLDNDLNDTDEDSAFYDRQMNDEADPTNQDNEINALVENLD